MSAFQSVASRCTRRPHVSAIRAHNSPKRPLQQTASSSPAEKRLQIAASMAPRPVVCTGSTGCVVPNTGAISSSISASSFENSGVRWWIIGRAPARSTRSGTRVGPGVINNRGTSPPDPPARFRLRAKRFGETSPEPWRRRALAGTRGPAPLAWLTRWRSFAALQRLGDDSLLAQELVDVWAEEVARFYFPRPGALAIE